MYVCCKKDPKFKSKAKTTKFLPRQYGDLDFTGTSPGNGCATSSSTPCAGPTTHHRDPSECIYGPQGQYYKDFDFSTAVTCEKRPVITDLPPESANDDKIGRLPSCCNNGTLLPKTMNETKSRLRCFLMEKSVRCLRSCQRGMGPAEGRACPCAQGWRWPL
ncbi:COBRA-like protein [Striga asiatica]|uniref:COBRA-like protein n=1 Tax=Striga asiatica TaxID=4170 RepID=A0A5A7NY61_STRAF|nr:COBRA-like protein [Striga asiatica]